MANAFNDVLEMTQVSLDNQLIDYPTHHQPLAMQSVSKLFKPNVNTELSEAEHNFKGLEEAILNHEMDLIKHYLLCKCPLHRNLKSFAQNSPNDAERLESTPGVDLMHLAAAYGRTDIVDILLKRLHQDDIDPEELFDLNSSLHHASKLNNKLLAEMLLKAGAYPWYKDDDGFSAMHHAAFNDSLIVMKVLVEHNGSIHQSTDDRRTPLHLAAGRGFSTLVEYLLCLKASTDVKDDSRNTPLHYACESGVASIVLLLLWNKCPVDHVNSEGKTGLFIAAEKGRASIIPILLSFGANIDMSCCPSNRTPLMVASELGHVTSILELISNGASLHCTDVKRTSALELALIHERDSAAALLILRENPYSDYVHKFIRTQKYPLCKVVKQNLVQSVAALLDRMVIAEAGNASEVKVLLQYLDTDVSNNLPSDSGFHHSKTYFVKLIVDNRLEDFAHHGTVRLYVEQRMNAFGRYFLFYKTILFFLFLLSMFFDFVVVAIIDRPNDYNLDFTSGLRMVAEVYVLCFWFCDVIFEVTEIVTIMHRIRVKLLDKRRALKESQKQEETEKRYQGKFYTLKKSISVNTSPVSNYEPLKETSSMEHDEFTEINDTDFLARAKHVLANLFITRFVTEYFSDSYNWFDLGGLISLFITFILRGFSSPFQWLFMLITFLLNCMRIFKLFNVYYSFGIYIRILVSVTLYELPPFLMFFFWTLFVFSGAYFVSLRFPTVWQCPNGTDCQLDKINNSTYTQGYDDTILYTIFFGLRVMLEQSPIYDDNYIVRLPWLSVIIFLAFLFITSVVYINLLIAQLADRYSVVKKEALKVVAWYRLIFIMQSQNTSFVARLYNFRKKRRVDSITITAKELNKYYGVIGVAEFVERGSPGFREYLPEIDNVQLLDHQKNTSRVHELNEKFLSKQVYDLHAKLDDSNKKIDKLTTEMGSKMDEITHLNSKMDEITHLNSKMDDIASLLSTLLNKS